MKRVDSSVAIVSGLKYRSKACHLCKSGIYEPATACRVETSKRKPHSRYLEIQSNISNAKRKNLSFLCYVTVTFAAAVISLHRFK